MGFYKELAQIFYYVIRSFKMIFKKKNLFFIGVIVFVVLIFGFYSSVFAVEETIDFTGYSSVGFNNQSNYFYDSTGTSNQTGYILVEPGYRYTLTYVSGGPKNIAVSDSVPAVDKTFTYLGRIGASPDYETSYSYIADSSSSSYLYVSSFYSTGISLTREKIEGYDNTIDNLKNAVSLDNLWSVFPPVLIAVGVLFALGYVVVKKVLKDDNNAY